jgi:uncharacterized protein (TIGR03067 family)
MRSSSHCVLFAILATISFPILADDDDIKAEWKKLDGTWQLISAVSDGKETPDDVTKKIKVVIKEGKHTVYFEDQTLAKEISFTIDLKIPDEAPKKCLAVPQSAVTSNDGRTFVFVETAPRTYRAQDVKTGLSVEPWVEIQSGLNAEDQIVTSGVAILKAELLLEPEE